MPHKSEGPPPKPPKEAGIDYIMFKKLLESARKHQNDIEFEMVQLKSLKSKIDRYISLRRNELENNK